MTIPGGYIAGDVLTAANMNLLPAGKVGRTTFGGSSQTGITTTADITSSSITFTAVTGRLYRITAFLPLLQVTSTGTVSVFLNRGGSDVLYMYRRDSMAAGERAYISAVRFETSISGSTTYKLRASTSAGTLTIENAVSEGYLVVEDVGPA